MKTPPRTHRVARRQFLRGAGGFTLGLPLLPSLLERGAEAAPGVTPRLFNMMTSHGGISPDRMFPADSVANQSGPVVGSVQGRWGTLTRTVSGSTAQVSPILRGSANLLTERIVARMNVLRGVDIPFYFSHGTGGHLGNYRRDNSDVDVPSKYVPTIDQVMAYSSSFYPSMSGIKLRAVVAGEWDRFSYNFSNPTAKTGSVQQINPERDPLRLFDALLAGVTGGGTQPPPAPARKPVVDRVLEHYRLVRNANRRLSPGDRQRLDDHMARLAELESKVMAVAPPAGPGAGCSKPSRPTSTSDVKTYYDAITGVIATAFICGTTRIASLATEEQRFVTFSGDWHQDIAHKATVQPSAMNTLSDAHRGAFENVFLALAQKLDVDQGNGRTYLDDTLMNWSQESGYPTHEAVSLPVVTIGSAGGWFKTGLYCDYRNQTARGAKNLEGGLPGRVGLVTHNRWLATILMAMGVPRSEWQAYGPYGFGETITDNDHRNHLEPGQVEAANDPMPFIKA